MKICSAENCQNNVFGKGYCKFHQYLREDKKQSPIKPFSEKRAKINRNGYYPKVRKYLETRQVCEINSPVCTIQATCVNHKKGRKTIDLLLNKDYWQPSCRPCNNYIEQYDKWARKNGHKLNTFL
jgi:hypothetical protein